MKNMNTLEIETMLQEDKQTKLVFDRVYAKDALPTRKYKNFPKAVIANTHASHQPGEHWVAFYFENRGEGEYFDSFGLPPVHNKFVQFLNKNAGRKCWTFNTMCLQSLNSRTCGLYCLLYIGLRCRGYDLNYVLDVFDNDTRMNDQLVTEYVHSWYHDI
jgi:hypothetical protein